MTTGELFIPFVPLFTPFTLSLLSNIVCSLWQHLKKYSNFPKYVFSPTRGMACVMSHVSLVSQSYCRVNYLGGKIPAASCYLCGLKEDLHQRNLPNAVTKKIFKTFQGQVSVDITDNFRSLPSEDNR